MQLKPASDYQTASTVTPTWASHSAPTQQDYADGSSSQPRGSTHLDSASASALSSQPGGSTESGYGKSTLQLLPASNLEYVSCATEPVHYILQISKVVACAACSPLKRL